MDQITAEKLQYLSLQKIKCTAKEIPSKWKEQKKNAGEEFEVVIIWKRKKDKSSITQLYTQ